VVLAGGRSSRFGSDKLATTVRGRPMLHHAVDALAVVCADVVVVLAPTGTPDLPPGVRTVRDRDAYEGPLAATTTGLAAVRTEWALVAGGDMPDLVPAVLGEMLRVADEAPVDAVALADGDRFRPMPSVLRVSAARTNAHALLASGERRLRALHDSLRTALIDEATWTGLDPERATLRDVDVPADLPDPGRT
jgi:molybdopterin-guanine dinucleotide biosynthesis protein A